jgi:hypothetical protein
VRGPGAEVGRTTVASLGDGAVAGAAAWALSGLPSTGIALLRRTDPLQATAAAGSLLLTGDAQRPHLLLAGALAHTTLCLGWATVLALALPRRHTIAAGVAAGMAVAGLDLGAVGRRYPRIRDLDTAPQVADHVAFGAIVATVVAHRRRQRRVTRPAPG